MSTVSRVSENAQIITRSYLPMCRKYGFRNINPGALKRIAVFPRLGILFNRVKKNANTTAMGILNELESGQTQHHKDTKKNTPMLGLDGPIRAHRNLDQYALIVITRDPYTRVLSAFLEKFRHDRFIDRYGRFDLDPEGFESFIHWLEDGGLSKDPHWDLQTKLMALPLSCYDFAIRFEYFAKDFQSILAKTQFHTEAERLQLSLPSDHKKPTHAESKAEIFYTENSKRIVQRIYNTDFDRLGYSHHI